METPANPYEAYDEKIAASDLRKYRENGPKPWTQALLDALKAEGVEGATVLNIGGGIGAIQDELLAAGASHATMIEASPAYLEAAREEGKRRSIHERVTYMQGDFLDLEHSVPSADIVTLERVLNVYPDWEQLARDSARHAQRLYGVVVPREGLFVRGVISLINLRLRLQGKRLRAHAVPADVLRQILKGEGFSPSFTQTIGPAWLVAVYRRSSPAEATLA
jgi:Methyltransferase domain